MHSQGWTTLLLRIWGGEVGKYLLGQPQTTSKGLQFQGLSEPDSPWSARTVLEPTGGSWEARVFHSQGLYCVAARTFLSEKHQRHPRNRCHFFHMSFCLSPDPVALVTCTPDLITGLQRWASVWIQLPKGKSDLLQLWVLCFQKGRGTVRAGKPARLALCESFQPAFRMCWRWAERCKESLKSCWNLGHGRTIWRKPRQLLKSHANSHRGLETCCAQLLSVTGRMSAAFTSPDLHFLNVSLALCPYLLYHFYSTLKT